MNKIFYFMLFFVISYSICSSERIDVVKLKNGHLVKGFIIQQIPGKSLKIKTISGNVFKYSMNEIISMNKESVSDELLAYCRLKKKDPTVAFALSLIIPGLGQHYNGQYIKGAIMEFGCIAGVITTILLGTKEESIYYFGWYCGYETKTTVWYYIGLSLAGVSGILSWIDAPLSANAINNKFNKKIFGHLFELDNKNYALGLDIGLDQKSNFGGNITLHF